MIKRGRQNRPLIFIRHMKYYFLQEDLDALDKRILELKNKIKEVQQDKHLSTTQSSETWHDNYGFEEGVRQINFLVNNIGKLLEIKAGAYIVHPKKNEKANIGSIITFQDETGKKKKIKIGSFLILNEGGGAVSYQSPLGKILMGAKKDEIRKGLIGGKGKEFVVLKIE